MPSWFSQLERAEDVAEVISVTRDYIASWTPHEIALLPERCRPGRIRDESDIENLHSLMVEEYRDSRVARDEMVALQKMTGFLVRASIRISQLRGDGQDDDRPPPGSQRSTLSRKA